MPEHAVRWRRASHEVMARQIAYMAEIAATMPNVEIAVIPETSTVLAAPLNGFVIFDDRLVTIELFSGEVVLRDPRDIAYHVNLFDFFYAQALTGSAATAFLEDLANKLMPQRD